MGDITGEIIHAGCHVSVHILGIERPDGHRNLADLVVSDQFVGIGTRVRTVIDRTTQSQTRHTRIVQSGHVGRTGEVVTLKDTLLTLSHPVVTIEAVGIQSRHDHRLVVEGAIAFAKLTQELDTRLMPGTGNDRHLTLGTR